MSVFGIGMLCVNDFHFTSSRLSTAITYRPNVRIIEEENIDCLGYCNLKS